MYRLTYNVNMIDIKKQKNSQLELNKALELLHFGFRSITAYPDKQLKSLGCSRVHHRILYFVGRHPDSSINELLKIMKVSKQYLNKPLKRLVEDGYISAIADTEDKRIKRLRLTQKGKSLEGSLTGKQREHLKQVFSEAGPQAEAGWRTVMKLLAHADNQR